MSSVPESDMIDINSKAKEAEAYYSHGLLKESLELYEQILSVRPDLDLKQQKLYEETILRLKKEIEDLGKVDETITAEDVSLFKETWTAEEDVQDILGSISAYKELGLFNEAVDEYMKLFKLDYPSVNIIPGLVVCLFETHSPSKAIAQIESIVNENNLSDQEKVETKFILAEEMEKRNHKELALEFFKAVKEIRPKSRP